MKKEYIKLIKEHDKTLDYLRKEWMEALDTKTKAPWREKLDTALDERLRLMKLRDEKN